MNSNDIPVGHVFEFFDRYRPDSSWLILKRKDDYLELERNINNKGYIDCQLAHYQALHGEFVDHGLACEEILATI